jgi:hypothetical protein
VNHPPEWGGTPSLNAHRLWKGADGITYDVWLDIVGGVDEPMLLSFVDTWGDGREVRRLVPAGTTLDKLTDAELQFLLNEGREWGS